MPFAPELVTHSQKVCSLYKRACRSIEAWYFGTWKRFTAQHSVEHRLLREPRYIVRYHQVILRSEFDKHKCVTDPKEQRRLYWLGEHELFQKHCPFPAIGKFPRSQGGTACERVVTPPDWVLDYWHPLEKAHYPEYFEKREARKCEYIQKWHRGELY